MKTLIIYDNEGYIIQQITGTYHIPVGVPYIEIDFDTINGRSIKSINIDTNELIFEELPKSELEIANEKIDQLQRDIADILLNMM